MYPTITIDRPNGQRLVTSEQHRFGNMSNWSRHSIPSFKEVIASISHEPVLSPTTPRDTVPRSSSFNILRMDQRLPRSNLAPHELRLNTTAGPDPSGGSMYTFTGARSPLSASILSPLIQTPLEPPSACSTTSSYSLKSMRGRPARKQPSSRPAAKRMRDTRDREGIAIHQMETDLEKAGELADLKPLNANNKEEAGRRYPKADVLERYCDLTTRTREELTRSSKRAKHDNRMCLAYEKWVQRWCSTLSKDAREQLEAMVNEIAAGERASLSQSFDSGCYSARSSLSDYDRATPTSAEWSTDDHEIPAPGVPHRPSGPFHAGRC